MATQIASVAKNGGGASAAIDTTGADLIIAWVSCWTGTPNFSDNKSNTWTPLTDRSVNSYHGQFFYCLSPTVGSGHTFTSTAAFPGIAVSAWFINGGVFDKEGGATASGTTTVQPGSLTPSGDNTIIFAGLSFEPATLTGIDSSFAVLATAINSGSVGASLAYLEQGTAAAVNPTWTVSANANLVTGLAVFTSPPVLTDVRVTQHVTETIEVADTRARVTQAVTEFAAVTATPARITQDIDEILRRAFTPTRITQNIVEILFIPAPFAPPDGCPTDLPLGTASDVQCPVDLPLGTAGSGACAPDWEP